LFIDRCGNNDIHLTTWVVEKAQPDTEPVWLCCTWISWAKMVTAISKGD
jgi:hypothetical protein